MAAILWAFSYRTPWLPRVRSRAEDLRTLWLLTRQGQVRVARVRGRVAGFIIREESRIHALYVAPRWRRRGIGRALLTEAKGAVATLELWVLVANAPARAFYERQGFAEVDRAEGGGNDEGLPDILMIWRRGEETG